MRVEELHDDRLLNDTQRAHAEPEDVHPGHHRPDTPVHLSQQQQKLTEEDDRRGEHARSWCAQTSDEQAAEQGSPCAVQIVG